MTNPDHSTPQRIENFRRNEGTPLRTEAFEAVQVNLSAVERRAATLAHPPFGEKGISGGVAGEGADLHRPDDACRRRHARARPPAVRQGDAPAERRTGRGAGADGCAAHGGRGLRLSEHGAGRRQGACRLRHPGGLGGHRLSGRPDTAAAAPGRDPLCGGRGCAGDRHRHQPRARLPAGLAGAL